MTKFLKKMIAVQLILVASTVSFFANAGLITNDYSFSVDNNNNYSGNFYGNYNNTQTVNSNISLDKFDATQGTLTDVNISFTSDFQHLAQAQSRDGSYERRSCGWSSCTYYYDDDVSVDATFSNSAEADILGVNEIMNIVSDRECSRELNNSTTTNCMDSDTGWETFNFDATFDLSATDLTDFIGADQLTLDFASISNTSAVCNSHSEVYCKTWNYQQNWQGTVTVAYEYAVTSVPAPGTLILFSLALVGLGARRFS